LGLEENPEKYLRHFGGLIFPLLELGRQRNNWVITNPRHHPFLIFRNRQLRITRSRIQGSDKSKMPIDLGVKTAMKIGVGFYSGIS